MLDEEVVAAVREGRFHVFAVRTIDEGIALLTGRPRAGGAPTAPTRPTRPRPGGRPAPDYAQKLRAFAERDGDGARDDASRRAPRATSTG